MKLRLANTDLPGVPLSQLEDGQFAQILMWGESSEQWVGTIIRRSGDELRRLDAGENDYAWRWSNHCKQRDCRVRILHAGDLLEIVH